ncbi:hypothetical protein NG54_07885 [Heyndrickxia ginsengihumi]|uniref:Uncharacterized protein n=1 Tax=Heyndrickxia ginsengihumi TaxID=363870 RepID=A0A0A6Y019_9BACI|nr:hypothetical protein [Heyndrickxia ginsengihumi]KHD85677.1 hypothetical protein NG54_07885 [Heyndrickxia ginsengihumi]
MQQIRIILDGITIFIEEKEDAKYNVEIADSINRKTLTRFQLIREGTIFRALDSQHVSKLLWINHLYELYKQGLKQNDRILLPNKI